MSACPRGHVCYLSTMLADNAVTLHQLAHPTCRSIQTFPHGDHFHIGHADKAEGDACKAADDRMTRGRRVEAERQRRAHGGTRSNR